MDTETTECGLQYDYCFYCKHPECAKHEIESLLVLLSPLERKVVLHRFIDHLESHPSIEKLEQTNCFVSTSGGYGRTCDACKKLHRRAYDLFKLLNEEETHIVLTMCLFDQIDSGELSCKSMQVECRNLVQNLENMIERRV